MKQTEGSLRLVEHLIDVVRITLKKADPDTIIFAGEVLRDLQERKEDLARQAEAEAKREAVAA
jgi:hypothetical protein